MTVQLSCTSCGGNRFAYPFELTDEAVIHCGDCGSRIGTIAEVTDRVASQITGDSRPSAVARAG